MLRDKLNSALVPEKNIKKIFKLIDEIIDIFEPSSEYKKVITPEDKRKINIELIKLASFEAFINNKKYLDKISQRFISPENDDEVDYESLNSFMGLFKSHYPKSASYKNEHLQKGVLLFKKFLHNSLVLILIRDDEVESNEELSLISKDNFHCFFQKKGSMESEPIEQVAKSSYIICDYYADIDLYPPRNDNEKLNSHQILTVGDMHGNALKLIYILIRHQILELSQEEYLKLVILYNTPAPDFDFATEIEINKYIESIQSFIKIIEPAFEKINSLHYGKLRFLGDLICDRGNNDFLTIKIIEFLSIKKMIDSIIISNHDYNALIHLHNLNYPEKFIFPIFPKDGTFDLSFFNMLELIHHKIITLEWVNTTLKTHFIPYLTVIKYSVEQRKDKRILSFYTHAPTAFFSTLEASMEALELKINRSDTIINQTLEVIESVNHFINDSKELITLKNKKILEPFINHRISLLNKMTISELKSNFPIQVEEFVLEYTSGHDSPGERFKNSTFEQMLPFHPSFRHTYNLDNYLGKTTKHPKGIYFSKMSVESPQLNLILFIKYHFNKIYKELNDEVMHAEVLKMLILYEKNNDISELQLAWEGITKSIEKNLLSSAVSSPSLTFHSTLSRTSNILELVKSISKKIDSHILPTSEIKLSK